MRKSQRKLRLSRETVHQLQPSQLPAVVGGVTQEIFTSCEMTATCSQFGGCGGGSVGCGTGTGTYSHNCPSNTYEIITSCQSNSDFC